MGCACPMCEMSGEKTACHNRRIRSHKVFSHLAERGKSSVDWFYGFKLHLIVNDQGELLAFHLTPGNVDDRKPVAKMVRGLFGKLFGDRGSASGAQRAEPATDHQD